MAQRVQRWTEVTSSQFTHETEGLKLVRTLLPRTLPSVPGRTSSSGTAHNLRGMEQTSAKVGPGDDGGALVDSDGQVIGMITTANTPSGQQSAVGFAIPINTAMAIAREISNGQASSTVFLGQPGFLGVRVKTSTSRDRSGALIADVIGGAPASRAGLAAGDVITGLNGLPVTAPSSNTHEAALVTARASPAGGSCSGNRQGARRGMSAGHWAAGSSSRCRS